MGLDAEDLTGHLVAGCRLRRCLGQGAIGAVWEGVHAGDGRRIAIKILHRIAATYPDMAERFEREARICYQLDHPHIVRVHHWGNLDDGRSFMVMDYVEGATLLDMIRRHGRLEWRIAATVVGDIAAALAHVHRLGIVHRDIKPANILVDRSGCGVLADLGLARQLVEGLAFADDRRLTEPGAAIGSPAYMAPEQVRDTSTSGTPADLYALGATLYHALAGRPPLIAGTSSATLRQVLRDEAVPISDLVEDLPADLGELITSCLTKAPNARPSGADAVARILRRCVQATVELRPQG